MDNLSLCVVLLSFMVSVRWMPLLVMLGFTLTGIAECVSSTYAAMIICIVYLLMGPLYTIFTLCVTFLLGICGVMYWKNIIIGTIHINKVKTYMTDKIPGVNNISNMYCHASRVFDNMLDVIRGGLNIIRKNTLHIYICKQIYTTYDLAYMLIYSSNVVKVKDMHRIKELDDLMSELSKYN